MNRKRRVLGAVGGALVLVLFAFLVPIPAPAFESRFTPVSCPVLAIQVCGAPYYESIALALFGLGAVFHYRSYGMERQLHTPEGGISISDYWLFDV